MTDERKRIVPEMTAVEFEARASLRERHERGEQRSQHELRYSQPIERAASAQEWADWIDARIARAIAVEREEFERAIGEALAELKRRDVAELKPLREGLRDIRQDLARLEQLWRSKPPETELYLPSWRTRN
jgi:hypothetical protein